MSHAASESPTPNETRAAARALRARFDGAFATARALDCLWVVSVFAGTFSAVLLFWGRVLLSDTYTSLTVGRLITQSGLPHKDTLTVAGRGATWIDQQWLAHLVVYESWRIGGYPLVGMLSAGLIATAFALLFVLMLSRGTNPVFAFGISGACFVVADLNFETRPQSFAYPLFMLLILLLAREERTPSFRPRLLLAWPILLLWGNLHGSVLLGVGVCLLYCALRSLTAARERRLTQIVWYSLLAIGAVVSSAITPYGTTIISYYPHLLGNPNLRSIAEWQPANYAGLSIPFDLLLAVAIGSICFAWGRGIRPSTFALALAAGLALMATQAVRYEVWFAFGAAFLLSDIRGRFDTLQAPVVPPQLDIAADGRDHHDRRCDRRDRGGRHHPHVHIRTTHPTRRVALDGVLRRARRRPRQRPHRRPDGIRAHLGIPRPRRTSRLRLPHRNLPLQHLRTARTLPHPHRRLASLDPRQLQRDQRRLLRPHRRSARNSTGCTAGTPPTGHPRRSSCTETPTP